MLASSNHSWALLACLVVCVFAVGAFPSIALASGTDPTDNEERVFLIEHAFGLGEAFHARGKVSLRFRGRGAVKFDKVKFTPEDVKAFASILKSDDFYRIRLVPLDSEGTTVRPDNEGSYVTNFVKACALRTSGFRETMLFHADVYGNVAAVDYNVAIPKCQAGPVPKEIAPQTKGKITMGRAGDKPKDTRLMERRAKEEAERAAKEPGFIGKYWMYILPLVLVFMFGGGGQ